LYGLK
jgi:hypothetical protein